MRKLLLFLALLVPVADCWALREVCGNGVDDDSSGGDLACPSPDADGDLFPSSNAYTGPFGAGVVDCADADRTIYPGAWTNTGCAANEFRKCNNDGSYGSCLAYSTLTAGAIDGSKYSTLKFCDPTKTADTGDGTYASPLNCLAFSKTSMSTYTAPAAGMFIVVLGTGAFTQTWSDSGTTRMLYVNNKDGTEANPIGMFWSSGASITGQGSDPSPGSAATNNTGLVDPFTLELSNRWNVWNLQVSGGFSNQGAWINGSEYVTMWNPKVFNVDGREDNNLAGVKVSVAAHHFTAYGGTFYDNYERDDANAVNNVASFVVMDSDDYHVYAPVAYGSAAAKGYGLKAKHTFVGATASVIQGARISNVGHACVDIQSEETTVKNSQLVDCNKAVDGMAVRQRDCDSTDCRFKNFVAEYNTIYGAGAFEHHPDSTYNSIGNPDFTFRYNVVQDDRATSYPADRSDGFIRIAYYGSDALYTDIVTGGKMSVNNNCYYNSAGTTLLMTVFGDAGSGASGADYSGFASWQTSGFDANSYNENPNLTTANVAQSSNCSNKGWNNNLFTQVTSVAQNGGHGCRVIRIR